MLSYHTYHCKMVRGEKDHEEFGTKHLETQQSCIHMTLHQLTLVKLFIYRLISSCSTCSLRSLTSSVSSFPIPATALIQACGESQFLPDPASFESDFVPKVVVEDVVVNNARFAAEVGVEGSMVFDKGMTDLVSPGMSTAAGSSGTTAEVSKIGVIGPSSSFTVTTWSTAATVACETCRGGRGGGGGRAAALRTPSDVLVRGGNGGGLPVSFDMFR